MQPSPRAYTFAVWPALLLAPLLALGDLALAFALVMPECANQGRAGLHAVSLVSLAAALLMTLFAWRTWHALPAPGTADAAVTSATAGQTLTPGSAGEAVTFSNAPGAESRPRFLALVATLAGAFSTLVIVALWVPLWFLTPCN